MLAIRMQRTGRRGHAQFRVIVQDSHFHPTRGKVVAYIGSYDPHTKAALLDKELAAKYLVNGAQPSDRAARLLKQEGVDLPSWVKLDAPKTQAVRNPDKRRSTRPEAPKEEVVAEAEAPQTTESVEEEAPVTEEEAVEPQATEPEATADAGPAPEPANTGTETAQESAGATEPVNTGTETVQESAGATKPVNE